ncbi:hypothetical protein RCO48_06625 [Peribacillus frigoritolerans]|nr:hypothetical protein [Peribacillus frigoritolerans]
MSKPKVLAITIASAFTGLFFLFCLGWAIMDHYGKGTSDKEVIEETAIKKK